MTAKEKSIAEMTTAELRQHLEQKEKEERKLKDQARRKYEKDKDAFVASFVSQAAQFHAELKQFKTAAIARGNELHDLMFEVFEKEAKELKSFTIMNEEKTMKVVVERAERHGFNETAEVAIAEIKDVLRAKFEGRNKGMYEIIDSILMKNTKGDYDERLVAKLRRHEETVDDKRFSEALDTLANAYYTTNSGTYIRAYKLNQESNKWDDIVLQFSAL